MPDHAVTLPWSAGLVSASRRFATLVPPYVACWLDAGVHDSDGSCMQGCDALLGC